MVIHELVLGIKFGMIVGGSVPNAVLQKVGYVANQAQTPEALAAIRNLTTLLYPRSVCTGLPQTKNNA